MGRNTTTVSMRRAVLVVDDDPDLVQLISTMLKGYEFDLLWAPSVDRARDIILVRKLAVLIVNSHVAEEKGLRLVAEMRQSPHAKHTPVLLMTAGASMELVVECRQLQVADFLIKPFDAKRLRKGLAKAITTANHDDNAAPPGNTGHVPTKQTGPVS